MAWPCISRVCCLARFWNQFDKSDLSVPLTIQNYSDISEQEVRSVTKQVTASERAPATNYTTPEPRARGSPRDGPGTRGSFRARREPSYKPREDYQPPEVPFPSVTQYKQDFKPWPIPRKDNFPWIGNGTHGGPDSPVNSDHVQGGPLREREERGRGQRWGDQQGTVEGKTSSYRQEFRPWTGARPARSARKPPPAQYCSPGTESTQVSRETSYQAAYSGDLGRATDAPPQQGSVIPAASNALQSVPAERSEEHLVRTKLAPNPSAVFQSGSRVFNI